MPDYPLAPTFPVDLRGGKGIKITRTGSTANTIEIAANLGNDVLAPMPAGTLKGNILGGAAAPQDVTLAALSSALGLKALAFKASAAIADVAGLPAALDGKQAALGFIPESTTNRGKANGYAPLGADGKVPPAFLPNLGGGGGTTPGTITADQISDSSDVGRSLLKGTSEQARLNLDVDKIYRNIAVLPEASLDWPNLKHAHYDKLLVTVGATSIYLWPGGGFPDANDPMKGPMHFGNTSAVTGAMHIPASADAATDGHTHLIFISAGLMGLISTEAHDAAAVGVYGQARAGVNQCRIWGANFGLDNKMDGIPGWGEPFHVNAVGCEIDVAWTQPVNKTGNSNVFGMTIAGEFQGGRPLGECSGVEVFAYNGLPWKIAYGTGHGAADKFAQISIGKKVATPGPASSQNMEWISCFDGQNSPATATQPAINNIVFRYGYMALNQVGDFVFQPNYYGVPGSLIIANAQLSENCTINPRTGFFGPAATVTNLSVVANATINGTVTCGNIGVTNVTAGGTVQGQALNTPGTISGRDLTLAADANIVGQLVAAGGRFNGNLEVTAALYAPNFFFFQGRSVSLAAAGQGPNANQRVLVVAA